MPWTSNRGFMRRGQALCALLATSIVAFPASGAGAFPRVKPPLFGVELSSSNGDRARLQMFSDGVLEAEGFRGARRFQGRGTYTLTKSRFCFKVETPSGECWVLAEPLTYGKPTSAHGESEDTTVTLTLREGDRAVLPKAQPQPQDPAPKREGATAEGRAGDDRITPTPG